MKVEAKKYTLSYDEYENDVKLLDKILKDKHLSEYKQITIGCWDYEGDDCSALLQGLIENKDKFAQIEGLFWGDIEQEEQEISWIEQADLIEGSENKRNKQSALGKNFTSGVAVAGNNQWWYAY